MSEKILKELIKNPKKISKISIDAISQILLNARELFGKETLLLEFDLDDPNDEIYVIGDIHGNLVSLIKIVETINKNNPKCIISLGDIVDRGPKQLECLILMLALKVLEPERFFILRGNHETLDMNEYYGFHREFLNRFNDEKMFQEILTVYDVFPYCALINNSILCLHGGIPENKNILNQLRGLRHSEVNASVLKEIGFSLYQMMWNDPKEPNTGIQDFEPSFRGPGIFFFGEKAFNEFMKENNLRYLIRAHECFLEGYKWFFNKRLLSIFSASNYRGQDFPNPTSYAIIKNERVIPINME